MTLRAVELSSVSEEIARACAGRPVQKITQPGRETVVLALKGAWLLLSAEPKLGRMHLLDEKPAGTGEVAPPFCMLLRKELTGARLISCAAVAGERAAELIFERAGVKRKLWLILFGRASQLVLIGNEGPLGAIGPARSIYKELPAPREPNAETPRFGDSSGQNASAEIAAFYEKESARLAEAAATVEARRAAEAAARRWRRLAEGLAADRARAESAIEKRKLGDLLLAHLHEVPRGAKTIELPDDFEGGAPIAITLDPARSPRENAERFYREHKRLTRAIASIDARLADAQRKLAAAEAELQKLDRGEAPSLSPDYEKSSARERSAHEISRGKTSGRKKARGPKSDGGRTPPYREFRSSTGAAILVGRGADRNDELTFQVARGSDLWLHTRDVPGAHVVVPLAGGRADDEATLLDAATLAAWHSQARDDAQVDVGYTLRKHVRKPPRSRPGTVTTAALKTLRVRVEPARLERLLASRLD